MEVADETNPVEPVLPRGLLAAHRTAPAGGSSGDAKAPTIERRLWQRRLREGGGAAPPRDRDHRGSDHSAPGGSTPPDHVAGSRPVSGSLPGILPPHPRPAVPGHSGR